MGKDVEKTKVGFVHLPKTAGQSAHKALVECIDNFSTICPARVEAQLDDDLRGQLSKYSLVSGHFDLNTFTSLPASFFTFTILRRPLERILSFYLYQRKRASQMTKSELDQPSNRGNKFALEASVDEFFTLDHPLRDFIDDHYHNFYSRFFAQGSYQSNSSFRDRVRSRDHTLIEHALEGINALDLVLTTDNLDPLRVPMAILRKSIAAPNATARRINVGDGLSVEARLSMLRSDGLSERGLRRIHEMTELDDNLFKLVAETRSPA